jgi:hypothetical protein
MIVSHRHKLVFTHIPKNAGTSIRRWLEAHVPDAEKQPDAAKHMTPHHVHSQHKGYTNFAVVRNPYDRLLSHYHFDTERHAQYLDKKSKLKHKPIYHEKYAELQKGFQHWLTHPFPIADRYAKWYDYRWCPQSMWCDHKTHVLQFETLAEDFQWVQEKVDVSEPLEILNTTNANTNHRTPTNRVMLAPHRDLIKSHLMVDFKRFNYSPDFDRSNKDFE